MAVPVRQASSVGLGNTAFFTVVEDSDTNPFFIVQDAQGRNIGVGINFAALVDPATGKLAAGTLAATSAGATTITGAFAASGGAAAINSSSNFNTVINDGTSTGTVTIGNAAAGAVVIASGAASSFSVTGANLTVRTLTSGTILLTSAGAITATGAAASSINITGANLSLITTTTGNIVLTAAQAITATGTVASSINITGANLSLITTTSGNIIFTSAGNITASAAVTAITSANANAFAVGLNGSTNPAFNVDASTASSATGINIKSAAAAGGVAISVISSGGNEALKIDAKGSGAITIGGTSTGQVSIGRGAVVAIIESNTKAVLSAQNVTPTAAQLIGGVVEHVSATGAGTFTLDTAANIDTAIAGAANGDSFTCFVANTGTQTSTVTTNTGLTLKGTVAIPTLKNAILRFFRTGAGAWTVYVTVSA